MRSAFTLDDSSPYKNTKNYLRDLIKWSEQTRKKEIIKLFSPKKEAVKTLCCYSRALCVKKSELVGQFEYVLN